MIARIDATLRNNWSYQAFDVAARPQGSLKLVTLVTAFAGVRWNENCSSPSVVNEDWQYLVVTGDGDTPEWHVTYSSALADVRRRTGLTLLHHKKGRTRRDTLQPFEQTFVHNGVSWHTAHVEEYVPANAHRPLVKVYCLQQR